MRVINNAEGVRTSESGNSNNQNRAMAFRKPDKKDR